MTRRRTFSDIVFAADSDNADLPVHWAKDVAVLVLEYTWKGFEQFRDAYLRGFNFDQPLDQLERDLARNHFHDLQRIFNETTEGFSSLLPMHEWDEMESLSSSKAKPPAYDFAFVHVEHRRWAWPIEAKVLNTPGTLAEYVKEIEAKYIPGIAAPLVGEAGMIGYLLSGSGEVFLHNLAGKLAQELEIVDEFKHRQHRTSRHNRENAPNLRLHHMVMVCN